MRRFCSRRGGAMIESALVFLVLGVLLAGIMELGIVGFAANAVSFAAHRAARYASLRGSASGRAASISDVQGAAASYAAPLNPSNLNVSVSWLPTNDPGNSVQVTVAYSIRAAVLPLSTTPLVLQSTARARIVQ